MDIEWIPNDECLLNSLIIVDNKIYHIWDFGEIEDTNPSDKYGCGRIIFKGKYSDFINDKLKTIDRCCKCW